MRSELRKKLISALLQIKDLEILEKDPVYYYRLLLLKTSVLIGTIGTFTLLFSSMINSTTQPGIKYVQLFLFCFFFFTFLYCNRKKRFPIFAFLICTLSWIGVTASTFISISGDIAGAYFYYPILILMMAFLFGGWQAALLWLLSEAIVLYHFFTETIILSPTHPSLFIDRILINIFALVLAFSFLRLKERQQKILNAQQLKILDRQYFENTEKLASAMAHEIKNPLSIIGLSANQLIDMQDANNPLFLKVKNKLNNAIERSVRIIDHFLFMTRMGQEELTVIDASKVIRDELERLILVHQKIKISQEIQNDINILSAKESLIFILQTIFENSVNAKANSIKINLSKKNDSLVLEVIDDGNGFGAEQLEISLPFQQSKPDAKGHGTSLFIARSIAIKMGYELSIFRKENLTIARLS